jgi:hypothetical protein
MTCGQENAAARIGQAPDNLKLSTICRTVTADSQLLRDPRARPFAAFEFPDLVYYRSRVVRA